jgi:hypothetical protein
MWKTKDFENRRKDAVKYFSKNKITSESITEYAVAVGVAIIVICDFVSDAYPEHKDMCLEKSKEIKKFYGIK